MEHHKSRHINPLISNAFNKAGLVEKFGTGITKMIDACKEAGNPEPLFETASTGLDFCVTSQASRLNNAIEKYSDGIATLLLTTGRYLPRWIN